MEKAKIIPIVNIDCLSYSKDYPKPKYIEFIEYFMNLGFQVSLYNAQTTVSKYVFIKKGEKEIKVRFSNHAPNPSQEYSKDSDYYIGRRHSGKWISSDTIKDQILKDFSTLCN